MNMLFRLLHVLIFSWFRPGTPAMGPCRTPFRCWPSDLDVLLHMNNGKYLSIMDLARLDLMIRSGLYREVAKRGWYPVVVAETIRFRKSIAPFARFDIESSVIGWDEKVVILQQNFYSGGACVAEAVIRGRFLKKSGGGVAPSELMKLAGLEGPSPEMTGWIRDWNASQAK